MKKMLTTAAFAVLATAASAQVSNFEGFSGGLNLNTVAASHQFGTSKFKGESWIGAIQGAYGFVISPSTVVSIGGSYGLSDSNAGVASLTNLSLQNQLSVYVEPGYLVGDKTLVYGKLTYEKANLEATEVGVDDAKVSLNGTGIGFGVRTMIAQATYLQVELKKIGYGKGRFAGDPIDFKTKSTVGTIGIGMKF